MRTVTNRLDKPVPGLQDVFLTVSLEGSLMSEEQKRKLNPMIVKVHSVTNLPDTPLSYEELSRTCLPVTTAYKFFKYPEHISEGKEHAKNMYWDDLSVFLAGNLKLHTDFNPSNAEATFVQRTRMQIFMKTI